MKFHMKNNSISLSGWFWRPNKAWELEFRYQDNSWVFCLFNSHWTYKGDHCGIALEAGLGAFEAEFNIYDIRHWFWDQNRFYKTGEESEVLKEKSVGGENA